VLLPPNVVPKKYTVQLEPHFEDFTFGTVSIQLDVVEPTKEIHFHAHKIKISNVRFDFFLRYPSSLNLSDWILGQKGAPATKGGHCLTPTNRREEIKAPATTAQVVAG